jgi:hypothetical protein
MAGELSFTPGTTTQRNHKRLRCSSPSQLEVWWRREKTAQRSEDGLLEVREDAAPAKLRPGADEAPAELAYGRRAALNLQPISPAEGSHSFDSCGKEWDQHGGPVLQPWAVPQSSS